MLHILFFTIFKICHWKLVWYSVSLDWLYRCWKTCTWFLNEGDMWCKFNFSFSRVKKEARQTCKVLFVKSKESAYRPLRKCFFSSLFSNYRSNEIQIKQRKCKQSKSLFGTWGKGGMSVYKEKEDRISIKNLSRELWMSIAFKTNKSLFSVVISSVVFQGELYVRSVWIPSRCTIYLFL